VTEATKNNVALLYSGAWITPPLASGCLPGVLRQVLIDEGELTEEVVMADDVRSADGLALLSSVYGWQPARVVEE